MKCQHCPKLASRQITEILGNGEFEEYHFCDECATKYLLSTSTKPKKVDPRGGESTGEKVCEHCGTRFVDFRNSGRLGCPHDYDAFQAELLPLLEGIHHSTRHAGKTPRRPSAQSVARELERLRQNLDEAVRVENYEEAARLRDRIRRLENL